MYTSMCGRVCGVDEWVCVCVGVWECGMGEWVCVGVGVLVGACVCVGVCVYVCRFL